MSIDLRQQIAALQQQVTRLEDELADAHRANRELRELAARQADRLQVMQYENEGAYRELYAQTAGAPGLDRTQPFGEPRTGAKPRTLADLSESLDAKAATETDPARRAAWRMIRRTDRGKR